MVDDPAYILNVHWAEISDFLIPLWLLVGAVVGFAGSLLVAHGVIPSLAATRELPDPRIEKLRPLLYGTALMFLAGAGFMVRLLVSEAYVIESFYKRWWI